MEGKLRELTIGEQRIPLPDIMSIVFETEGEKQKGRVVCLGKKLRIGGSRGKGRDDGKQRWSSGWGEKRGWGRGRYL